MMLQINNLHKTYKHAPEPSLQGLNIQFSTGIIAGLLGPNGAGKTTTISIICGLVAPDNGDVVVLGDNVRSELDSIKKKIGVVPQSIALYPQLSVFENLQYVGKLYGLKGTALKDKIYHYLKIFGLDNNAKKSIKHFSGGMKRRANIIAALLHEPVLLILDEPTAGVDVQSRNMIMDFLKMYNAQGHSIIYTSHLLEEAQELCDEVAIIDNGKLVVHGNTEELISSHHANNLEDLFLKITGTKVRD
ncbi:ABC transporter ATP-binding protein [Pinibacter soli]|uniref:ABC transporter ATP-binding protein n=1 Tax=Pinibacter soli TaxID=3044211 RepID=A0ABT6RHX9_9BACT|nr:ABC transporter ATP-binding protein [Pinibacter soli]MDI3322181.1 ABC transporter ATP-binding protein [Pinibacter soli]